MMSGGEHTLAKQPGGCDEQWEWETYDPAELATWPTPPMGREALKSTTLPITLVWKLGTDGQRKPWVYVAESAVLRANGIPGERGLYAWKDFGREEIIGRYTGDDLGEYRESDTEAKEAAGAERVREGSTMVLELYVTETRVRVIDGSTGKAPFLQYANDSRDMEGEEGEVMGNSAWVARNGIMMSMRKKRGEGGTGKLWGATTKEGGWREQEQREILWAYGNEYWKQQAKHAKATQAQGMGGWTGTEKQKAARARREALAVKARKRREEAYRKEQEKRGEEERNTRRQGNERSQRLRAREERRQRARRQTMPGRGERRETGRGEEVRRD